MRYEISKSAMCSTKRYDPFYIIKAKMVDGSVKYYEGYSELYDQLQRVKNAELTQFVRGLKLETTFSSITTNDLTYYTGFSPETFDDFMFVLSTGKNYLNVSSADLFNSSTNGDQLIGIQYADEYKAVQDDEDSHHRYKRIHHFMNKDGLCYYLFMNVDNIYVPFLVRDFDPME